ncbi:MAG: hypothetical protein DI539_16590 [Flavobacterium psychrophilum]|nr:MAG: hypothetical protein DI539_16590 [Flavobacterium psychrophilum]
MLNEICYMQIKNESTKNLAVIIISILYSVLFLYTAITKLIDYDTFREQMASSPIPSPVSTFIAWSLPTFEIILAGMLIIPRWRFKSLKLSIFIMILFTIYTISLMTFSDEIPCGCGGIIASLSRKEHIIFNCIYILLGIWAILIEKQLKKVALEEYQLIRQNHAL